MAALSEVEHCEVFERLSSRSDRVRDLTLGIREAVLAHCDSPTQLIYDTYALSIALTYSGRLSEAFIHIAAYKQHVNLGFNKGALLDDPKSLLKGSGSRIRHIRIDSLTTLKKPAVVKLIKAAERRGMESALERGPLPEASIKVMSKK